MRVHLAIALTGASLLALADFASAQFFDRQPGQNFPNAAQRFGGNHSENIDVGDVDNDGDLDVIVGNGGDSGPQPNRIFINNGGLQAGSPGTFVEQTNTRFAGVPNDTSRDIEFADIDNDGDLDIYVSNRGTTANGGETSRFYINQGGTQGGTIGFYAEDTNARWGTLISVPGSLEIGAQDGTGAWRDFSCDCDFADFDDDGDLDLFHSSYGPNINGNTESRIFLNDGAGVFHELWPWANAGADIRTHTMDLDPQDLDDDWDIDVFMSSRDSQARVYINNCYSPIGDSPFTDVTQTALLDTGAALNGSNNYEGEFTDIDGDGDFDQWMKNYDGGGGGNADRILRNNWIPSGARTFTEISFWIKGDPVVDENEIDFLDYDGDGDLDAFVANFLGTNYLYGNSMADGNPIGSGIFHRTGTGAGGSLATGTELPTNGTNGQTSLDGECADMDNDGDTDVLLANDSGSQNRYFENTLGIPDTHAPTVHRWTDQCDKPVGSSTVIHVSVRDNSAYYIIGYYDADLIYSVNGGGETTVSMFSQGGQQFRGVIPPQSGTVSYRLEITDRAGNTGSVGPRSFVQSGTTYTNLGSALNGTHGSPAFVGTGTWEAGTPGTLTLSNALGSATAGLFIGFAANPTPFKGGNLVPVPFLDPFIFVTPAGGGPVSLPLPVASFPKDIPCGLELVMQWVIQDAGATAGFALSNAQQIRAP